MTCPVCGGYTMIIDSRNKNDHKNRRRICMECGYKFNTIEIDMDLYLIAIDLWSMLKCGNRLDKD